MDEMDLLTAKTGTCQAAREMMRESESNFPIEYQQPSSFFPPLDPFSSSSHTHEHVPSRCLGSTFLFTTATSRCTLKVYRFLKPPAPEPPSSAASTMAESSLLQTQEPPVDLSLPTRLAQPVPLPVPLLILTLPTLEL
jgi:hypothetical protein